MNTADLNNLLHALLNSIAHGDTDLTIDALLDEAGIPTDCITRVRTFTEDQVMSNNHGLNVHTNEGDMLQITVVA